MSDIRPCDFLDGLPSGVRKIAEALRRVVASAVPQAEETVVWNCLSYHRPEVGGRVKGAVCQIVVRKGQVRLDFIHGKDLADPAGLLQGTRIAKRFVPIGSVTEAHRPEIAELIREASKRDACSTE